MFMKVFLGETQTNKNLVAVNEVKMQHNPIIYRLHTAFRNVGESSQSFHLLGPLKRIKETVVKIS